MIAPGVMEVVSVLSEEDVEKVYDFATFLRYISKREDEEDARAIFERADEPEVLFDTVKEDLGLARAAV